jgi:hypothetical protein
VAGLRTRHTAEVCQTVLEKNITLIKPDRRSFFLVKDKKKSRRLFFFLLNVTLLRFVAKFDFEFFFKELCQVVFTTPVV